MKLKKWMLIPVFIILAIAVFLFAINSEKQEEEENPKPVKVISVQEKTGNFEYEYSGTVQPEIIKKIAFKIPGKISKFSVSLGEKVNKGARIASLETNELQMAAEASKNTLNTAKSSFDFLKENYEKMIKIHAGGGISTQELEKIKLEKENAENLYNNAKIDYENKQLNLNDSTLKSDITGYIIDVLYEEGEIVPAGYPVVIIRSIELEVSFGLSQEDISLVGIGNSVRIVDGENEYKGIIKNINQAPESSVRTYETKIKFEGEAPTISVGSIVEVYIEGEEEKGIWIPLDIILNDGEDYVFAIDEENFAHKKVINIKSLKNTLVKVSGLTKEEKIVSEGFRNLREGDIVLVKK